MGAAGNIIALYRKQIVMDTNGNATLYISNLWGHVNVIRFLSEILPIGNVEVIFRSS